VLEITMVGDYDPNFYKDIWFKPSLFIDLYLENESKLNILKNRERSKKIRELYPTSLFALLCSVNLKRPHWVKPVSDTFPDTQILFLSDDKEKERTIPKLYLIENTTYQGNNYNELLMLIKKKAEKYNRSDEKKILMIHIIKIDYCPNYQKLSREIKLLENNAFDEILILHEYKKGDFQFTCLYPNLKLSRFNLAKYLCSAHNQITAFKYNGKYFGYEWEGSKIKFRLDNI
jgi:hypothetical protein